MNLKTLYRALPALTLLAATVASAAPAPKAQDIAAAERAFAADGAQRGIGPSFVTWSAPDGVVLRPDPVNARETYGKVAGPKPGAPVLKWWPVRAGIARSGDLGFDTGPWVFGDDKAHGWFFTVWRRQPDGSWKWLLDHGLSSSASSLGPNTPLMVVKTATGGVGSASGAFAQVQAEEAQMAAELGAGKLSSAYTSRLAPDGWIAGLEPDGPQMTPQAVAAALPKRPQTMATEPLGGGASKAGDLAYTFGKAHWTAEGKSVEGRYARVWQHRGKTWKIVFDEITPN